MNRISDSFSDGMVSASASAPRGAAGSELPQQLHLHLWAVPLASARAYAQPCLEGDGRAWTSRTRAATMECLRDKAIVAAVATTTAKLAPLSMELTCR